METVFSFLLCLAATTVGAISGIGGGVIIKPVLDAVSGMSAATISFLSGCTVLAMAAVSLLRSRGGGVEIERRRGTLLAVGAAAGGVLGKQLFDLLCTAWGDDRLVGTVQSVVMVGLTVGVLVYTVYKSCVRTLRVERAVPCAAIGLLMGILSAFLGIGGGPINLAALSFFFSMETKTAALHSIYIILFSQIASFASTILCGGMPPFGASTLWAMIAGGVAGGFLGRALTRRMSGAQVDRLFRVILLCITLISIYNVYRYASL